MGDRIVYVVEKLTRQHVGAGVEFVDDNVLADLMGQGFEVTSTVPDRKVQANGKTVKATMMVLRPSGENRGVSIRGRERADSADRGVVVRDEYGRSRTLTPANAAMHEMTRALRNMGSAGHLGAAGNHDLPGMSIISGEMTGKAFDLGALAAHRGEGKETSPFPRGTPPHTLWLQGWTKIMKAGTQSVSEDAISRADTEGYELAVSLGADDEVHCPYAEGQQKQAWLDGFQRGGGIIER